MSHGKPPLEIEVRKQVRTKRTPELEESLLTWVADGNTLTEWCRQNNLARRTVYYWTERDADLADRMRQARNLGQLAIEDQVIEIADDKEQEHGSIHDRKLKVWARLQLLDRWSKWQQLPEDAPKLMSDEERQKRIRELLQTAQRRELERTDNADSNAEAATTQENED